MSKMAAHLLKTQGNDEYLARSGWGPCRVARLEGLTICRHEDGVTIRQDLTPYVLVYSEDADGKHEDHEPLLLRYYMAELLRKFPLDFLTVI